jgi:putative flippase GtrA
MRLLWSGRKRILTFATIGVSCFLVQFALLSVLVHLGAYRPAANAVAFAISAQLNFLLSTRITWRDRPSAGRRGTGARWLAYNGTALVSLGCNTAVFVLAYHAIGTTPAAALGVIAGTCLVYLACNLLVFRSAAPVATSVAAPPGLSSRPVALELDENAVL